MNRSRSDSFEVELGRVRQEPMLASPFAPVMLLGPHRSRKTTSLVIPPLLDWPGSALVTSLREDVIEQSIESRRARGDVMIVDPTDILSGWPDRVGWSPLDFINDWDEALSVARILVESGDRRMRLNENFWTEAAIMQLAPYLLAAAKNGRPMFDVLRWIHTSEETEVAALLESAGETDIIESARSRWGQGREQASTKLAILTSLSVWERRKVTGLSAAESRLQFKRFLSGASNTLYVCASPYGQNEYMPYYTAFMRLFLQEVYKSNSGFANFELGLRGPIAALEASEGTVYPLLVVLDDTGSISPIPEMSGLVSTAVKAAIQLITVFTDVSQIEGIYGKEIARSILNNHSEIVVYPGSRDSATAEFLDQLLRNEQVSGLTVGQLPSDAVRKLAWGKALALSSNRAPLVVDLRSSLADSDLLSLRHGNNII